MAHDDGGEEGEGVFGEYSFFDFVVGDDVGESVWMEMGVPYQFLKTLHGPWI